MDSIFFISLILSVHFPRSHQTPTSVRCFKCGEYGHHALECKSTIVNCFKCGKTSHCAADYRSNNFTCFNCGERGHISTLCEKPKKDRSRGKVFAFPRSETTASNNLIQVTCFINILL